MEKFNWLQWRKKGIGSSDVPIIMGESEFMTRFELWKQKTSRKKKKQETNFVCQIGNNKEPIAREKFNLMNNKNMVPKCVQREIPFKVSLDGIDGDEICEVKYIGKEFFTECPAKHLLQIQYQLIVTQAIFCYYIQINDNDEIMVMTILPDKTLQDRIIQEVLAFWDLIITKKPPELCKDDVIEMDKQRAKLVKKYVSISEKIKKLEDELEPIKKAALEGLGKFNYQLGHYRITYSERKGSVDYSKIPEIQAIDLEQYRKRNTSSWSPKWVKNTKT